MRISQLKLEMLLVSLLMGTLLLSNTFIFAQSLEGKWIPPGEKGIVMQFTKDSVIIYNLDKRIDAEAYIVKKNKITIDTDEVMDLQFVTPNRLRLIKEGTNNSKDIIRLQPTKTILTSDEIEKIAYYFSNDDTKRSFRFNVPNESSNKLFKLEKIDSTYFLSEYSNSKRRQSASIESITPEKLVVYLSPVKSMILIGKDIDEKSVKTNTISATIEELPIAELITGKWFYSNIQARPPLSDCTKKTYFEFTENMSLETKAYAENYNNGDCIAGSKINGTYEPMGGSQIKITQNGETETWKVNSISETTLIIERKGSALRLTKE